MCVRVWYKRILIIRYLSIHTYRHTWKGKSTFRSLVQYIKVTTDRLFFFLIYLKFTIEDWVGGWAGGRHLCPPLSPPDIRQFEIMNAMTWIANYGSQLPRAIVVSHERGASDP